MARANRTRHPTAAAHKARSAAVKRPSPAPKAASAAKPSHPSKPSSRPAGPMAKGKAPAKAPPAPRGKANASVPAAVAAPEAVPPPSPNARRHLLSLSFLRDGDEFLARLEMDSGQITEMKNRSLDQLLTLVAGELEDLLE